MAKRTIEEKKELIEVMIKLMKEKGINGYQILEKTEDVDKCYEKALRYNRINHLVNLKEMEERNQKEEMESNEDFIKGIEAADERIIKLVKNDGINDDVVPREKMVVTPIDKGVMPTLSNIEILMEALSMEIKVYDLGFLNMLGTNNVKVGFKDEKTCVYFVREIGKFINVNV